MTLINKAMIIMDCILAPNHIIKIGPNATLGNEFNIVRKGSNTLYNNGKI